MNYDMTYEDVHVVDDFDEAQQFRYEHNDEPVEVGTAVGYDKPKRCMSTGLSFSFLRHTTFMFPVFPTSVSKESPGLVTGAM